MAISGEMSQRDVCTRLDSIIAQLATLNANIVLMARLASEEATEAKKSKMMQEIAGVKQAEAAQAAKYQAERGFQAARKA